MSAPAIISSGTAAGGPPVGGTGTTNTIPRWTGPSTLGDSQLKDNGTLVGIGASLTSGNRLVIGGVASGTSFIKANEATFQIGNIFAGPVQILTSDTPQVTVTGTGNVGIGTTPNAWATSVRATEMRTHALWNYNSGSDSVAYWTVNAYLNSVGTPTYKASTSASQYTQIGGAHVWERAASGTAGNAVTWIESARIDSSGRLIVGSATSPGLASGFITAVGSSSSYLGTWKTASTAGGCLVGSGSDPLELWRTSGTFGSETYTKILSADTSNNLILNAANTGATIQAAGTSQGLKLPATPGNADTQTLDCYQENPLATTAGNGWTPTLSAAATWGGTQPTVDYARYIRIGSLVFCEVRLSGAALTSTIGSTTISMPPATINSFATESTVQVCATGANNGVGICNSTTVFLPTLGSSSLIRLSWFYFTTS